MPIIINSKDMHLDHYHKRKKQKKNAAIPRCIRWMVLEKANGKCELCGRTIEEHGIVLTVDHIIPRSKGGTNDIENLRALCYQCNIGKGNKYVEEAILNRRIGNNGRKSDDYRQDS